MFHVDVPTLEVQNRVSNGGRSGRRRSLTILPADCDRAPCYKLLNQKKKKKMNANIQIEEPFTSESRIEEVFVQQEHSGEIPKEIPDASNLTNHVKSTAPKEVDTFGKEMEGYIVPDHYETYLRSLRPGQEHVELTVAKESHALWSIVMKIDHQIDTECIVDPGSQIIAMSEAVCHDLALKIGRAHV